MIAAVALHRVAERLSPAEIEALLASPFPWPLDPLPHLVQAPLLSLAILVVARLLEARP